MAKTKPSLATATSTSSKSRRVMKAPAAERKAAAPREDATPGKREQVRALKLKLLTKENPKREGSSAHTRFELYNKASTIGEFIEAGGTMTDIHYDIAKGHIEVPGFGE